MISDKNTISLTTTLSLVALFFTLSGGLWHLGYWSTFKFNYFEYASLTDLFKSSFYLFADRIWFVFGFIFFPLGSFIISKLLLSDNAETDNPKDSNLATSKKSKLLGLAADITITILFLIISIKMLIYTRFSTEILPYLISICLLIILIRYKILSKLILDENIRIITIFLLVVYPTFNFFLGKKTSLEILDEKKASIITEIKTDNPILNITALGSPYLGSSSEYHFIYFYGGSVQVIKKEIVDNFTIFKTSNYRQFDNLKTFEERMEYFKNHAYKLDTTKAYYDPGLKLNIDSTFRKKIRDVFSQ